MKLAIIDTGIDGSHPLLKNFQENGQIWSKSWIEGEPATVDHNGHGTHVAHSVLRVAPRAELYVAKVFKTGEEDELDQNKSLIANVLPVHLDQQLFADKLTLRLLTGYSIRHFRVASRHHLNLLGLP